MSDIEYPQIDINTKLNNYVPDRTYLFKGRGSKIIKDGMYRPEDLVDLLVEEIIDLDLSEEIIEKLGEQTK